MSKILIVEDDPSIQALLHDFIKEAGHNIVLAADGVEALAKYSEQPFDLVLLLRRTARQNEAPQTLSYKTLTLDLGAYRVYSEQGDIDLTPREFEILRELILHKGRILTRQNLLQMLWKYEFLGDERIVDTHIKNLRKKLGEADYIETIRGVGYRIDKEN